MSATSPLKYDRQVWKKLTDYEALLQGLCELIPLSDDIEGLLVAARVSDTTYYRKIWERKISVMVLLRIVRALVQERNLYLNTVKQFQKRKNG